MEVIIFLRNRLAKLVKYCSQTYPCYWQRPFRTASNKPFKDFWSAVLPRCERRNTASKPNEEATTFDPKLCTDKWSSRQGRIQFVLAQLPLENHRSFLQTKHLHRACDANTEQSLMIFFKWLKENGPGYVANLIKPRVTPYNLRSNGLNVVQTSYNSRFLHGSYAYMISHIWNQLSSAVKNAPNASSFRRFLTKLNFIGCQCSNCLWPELPTEKSRVFWIII